MKWIAEIFVVCLCLGMGGMYVMNQQHLAEIERLEGTLAAQNIKVQFSNQDFLDEQRLEVEEEIYNQGKFDNKGMIDTLSYLEAELEALFDKEPISTEEGWRIISWMKAAHDAQLLPHNNSLRMMVISTDYLNQLSSAEVKAEILLRQWDLLEVFNNRLGTTSDFSPRIEVAGIPMGNQVFAGDTANIWVQIPYDLNIRRRPKIRSQADVISQLPGQQHVILRYSTDAVLKEGESEGWLSYAAEIQLPRLTGGYENHTVTGKIKVVRR